MKKLLLLTVLMAVIFTLAISVTSFAVFAEETEETLIIGGIYTYTDEDGTCEVTIVSGTKYSAHLVLSETDEIFDYTSDYTYLNGELTIYMFGEVLEVFTIDGYTLTEADYTETPPETAEEGQEIDYSAIINALLTANENEDIDYDALVASLQEAMESEEEDAVGDWFTDNWGIILTALIGVFCSIFALFGGLSIFKKKVFEGDSALANAIIGTLETTKLKVNVEEIVRAEVKKIAVELSDSIDKVSELSNKVEPLFKSLSTVMMYVALPIAKSNKSMTTAERLEMLTSIQDLQHLLSVANETLSEDITAQIELAQGE